MNKSELIAAVAARSGLSGDGARQAVEALFGQGGDAGVIAAALGAGERVMLAGFGTFEPRRRKEREGRNPHTRERIRIPASVVPAFRPGAALRDSLRPARNAGGATGVPQASPA